MKLNGQPLAPVPHTMTLVLQRHLGDSLTLQLRPLPLGFHRRLRERGLVPPPPPTRVARDSQGRPLRDAHGLAVSLTDTHDAHYLCELERYHQRIAVLSIAESLRSDPELKFETTQPTASNNPLDWTRYADELAAELETAAFTAGDLIRICDAICRLSNLVDQHIAEQHANFSSDTSPNPT